MTLILSGDIRLAQGYTRPDDADAAAYIAAVEAADGQPLETEVRMAINAFVKGCKADGIWDAIKASCILAGARTLNGALVPLVQTFPDAAPTRFGTAGGWNYNRKTGLQGNGTDNYINSGRNNNADPQNSNHVSVYLSTASTTESGNLFGSDGVATVGGNNMFVISGSLRGVNRGSGIISAFIIAEQGATTGFKGYSRSVSTNYTVRSDGTGTVIAANSSAPTNRNIFIYARNDATSPPQFASDPRIAFYSIGEALDLALLDARVTDLINAFGAVIP